MDFQSIFNTLIGIIIGLFSYIMSGNRSDHKDLKNVQAELSAKLQKSESDLLDKIQKVEVTMVRDFATTRQLEQIGKDIFAMLHRIEDKLDRKVDK